MSYFNYERFAISKITAYYGSHAIIQLILLAIYVLTLIPAGTDSESHYEELLTNENTGERTSLLRNSFTRNELSLRRENF